MISFSYPAETNKSFITHRRDIHFIFLAKERRFAFANSERSTLETLQLQQPGLYYMDFTSSDWTLGFDTWFWHTDFTNGLNESADEGQMAEGFDEYYFLFLPCRNE